MRLRTRPTKKDKNHALEPTPDSVWDLSISEVGQFLR